MLTLRPYQSEAVDAAFAAWANGMMRVAEVLPTGAGKTIVFAKVISVWLSRHPGKRALVIAHRTELIDQAAGKIRSVAPELGVGIVKAERNQTLSRVIVGSVQTLASAARRRMLRDVGLVVVDECHHATAATYRAILAHYGCMDGRTPALGVTATMTRGDGAALGAIWEDVVYQRSISDMINDPDGPYLVRPHGKRVMVDDLNLSKVRRSGGDYSAAGLDEAVSASMAPEAIARAYGEHARDRQGIAFLPGVASAGLVDEAFKAAGFSSAMVHGGTPAGERQAALDSFMAGNLQILTNCMVFTEGTDLPPASCAVLARPTMFEGLYVQMAGRVLRLWPGKTDALILDVVGASQRHALHSRIDLLGEDLTGVTQRPDDELAPDETDEADEGLTLDGGGLGFDPTEYVDGALRTVDVDLFHGSESMWLRTYAGYWFVPAGERFIAILPSLSAPGGYDVTAMHRSRHGTGEWIMTGVSDLAYAMAWAEGSITPAEQVLARKERSWRARKPTNAQRDFAARLRVVIPDAALSGEVSNLITRALASQRIDPIMASLAPARMNR